MRRLRGMVCASAVICVLLAGCASVDLVSFFAVQSQASGHDRIVAGSLEVVAQSAQSALTKLGLAATMNRKGEAIYITSKTAAGSKLTLVLTREKTKDGEQTRVHVEWDGPSDVQVLAELEALGRL